MKLTFSQGIVSHSTTTGSPDGQANFWTFPGSPSTRIQLVAPSDQPFEVAFAHRDTNYFLSLNDGTIDAWGYGSGNSVNAPFSPTSGPYFLWIGLDRVTGDVEYGYSIHQPTSGATPPYSNSANRPDDQHWFDSANRIMKVWNKSANRWVEVVRVFVAVYAFGSPNLTSLSANAPSFLGTSAGETGDFSVGSLLFDSNGNVVKRTISNNTTVFFTTEDAFFTGLTTGARAKYETFLVDAIADEPIAAYTAVGFNAFNRIVSLEASNQEGVVYGIVETGAGSSGDLLQVVVSGQVRNSSWNWSTPNQQIFVDKDNPGILVTVEDDGYAPFAGQAPFAVAIDTDAILLSVPTRLQQATTADHGSLSGLGDDDHPQYLTNTRGDARYYLQSQLYTQVEVDALIAASTTLNGLSDVAITDLSAGEVLAATAGSPQLWENQTLAEVDIARASNLLAHTSNVSNPHSTNLALLTDVDVTGSPTLSVNDVIRYDGSNWRPVALELNSLNDVTTAGSPAPAAGNLLRFDGSQWVPSELSIASIGSPAGAYIQGALIVDELDVGDPGFEDAGIVLDRELIQAPFKVNDYDGFVVDIAIHKHSLTTAGALLLSRSLSADQSHGDVVDGTELGTIDFAGWHTDSYYRAAEISVEVDGTPSAGDIPGRLLLKTVPEGGSPSTPETVLALHADKTVELSESTPNVGSPQALANRLYNVGGNLFWNAIQLDTAPALSALTDVDITGSSPALDAGDALVYNGTYWAPENLGSSGALDSTYLRLDASNDPLTSTLTINGVGSPALALVLNGDLQMNSSIHLNDGYVELSSLTTGIGSPIAPSDPTDKLYSVNGELFWANNQLTVGGSVAANLGDLLDVDLVGSPEAASDGDVLTYNAAASAWQALASTTAFDTRVFGTGSPQSSLSAGDGAAPLATGDNNVVIGQEAGLPLGIGSGNTILGALAGDELTDGNYNVAVGYEALCGGSSAEDNIAIGYQSGKGFFNNIAPTAFGQIFIGSERLISLETTGTNGWDLTYRLGYPIFINSTNSINWSHIHYYAGRDFYYYHRDDIQDVTRNVVIGNASDAVSSGDFNTTPMFQERVGWQTSTAGAESTSIQWLGDLGGTNGVQFLKVDGDGDQTVFGAGALDSITTGLSNTAVGYQAGASLTTAGNNTFIGYRAGFGGTSGSNVAIGREAAENITTATTSVFIGDGAARSAGSAAACVAIGYQALQSHTGNFNIAIGREALDAAGSGASNVAIGHNALGAVTSGSDNVAIGYQAGNSITSGSDNVLIGYDVDTTTATSSNELRIGNRNVSSIDPIFIDINGEQTDVHLYHFTGSLEIADAFVGSPINDPTDKLYNVGGNLYWNGTQIDTGVAYSTAVWSTSSMAAGNTSAADGPLTSGGHNTVFGYAAGASLDSGAESNTLIGSNAGTSITSGDFHTIIGHEAGTVITTGLDPSVMIGYRAGYLATNAADDNIFIGANAGYQAAAGGNTVVGNDAMSRTGTGLSSSNNVVIGNLAGTSMNDNDNNVIIGAQAAGSSFGGSESNNVIIGYDAQGGTGAASDSVIIGFEAGQNATGLRAAVVGYQAGVNADGNNNTALGYQALGDATGGSMANNVAVGYQAGYLMQSGVRNVMIGYEAGDILTTGDDNIAIGYRVDPSSNSAVGQIRIGNRNLSSVDPIDIEMNGEETGWHLYHFNGALELNDYTGSPAAPTTTTDKLYNVGGNLFWNGTQIDTASVAYDTAVWSTSSMAAGDTSAATAFLSGSPQPSGAGNTIFGYAAGSALTSGTNNVFIGLNAGDAYDTDSGITAIGYHAGRGTGLTSTFIGFEAGQACNGPRNVALGYQAMGNATGSILTSNVVIGYQAGDGLNAASNMVLIGDSAGSALLNDSDCVFIGAFAGETSGTTRAVYIGSEAGRNAAATSANVAIGYQAAQETDGNNNTALGYQALGSSTGGSMANNVAIGYQAGDSITSGSGNTIIGSESGTSITTNVRNTFIGREAGKFAVNPGTDDNVFIGYQAGYAASDGDNVAIGRSALGNLSGGAQARNIAIGYQAGDVLTTGDDNVIIGYQVDPSSTSAIGEIRIGNRNLSSVDPIFITMNGEATDLHTYNFSGVFDGPYLRDYHETVTTSTATGGSPVETLDTANGNFFDVTLNDDNVTFDFVSSAGGSPGSEIATTFTLIVRQISAGSPLGTVTWPANVLWDGGTAPTITQTVGAIDMFKFTTVDGGATWLGRTEGQNFS